MSYGDWESIQDYEDDIKKGEAIALIWHIDDVMYAAEDMGVTITTEQAKEVLGMTARTHDATLGVSWDTLAYWINEVTKGD